MSRCSLILRTAQVTSNSLAKPVPAAAATSFAAELQSDLIWFGSEAKSAASNGLSYTKNELVPKLKLALNPFHRYRERDMPSPQPGYIWNVTWAGKPDTRASAVDLESIKGSFSAWNHFTLGTVSFWTEEINKLKPPKVSEIDRPEEELSPEGRLTRQVYMALSKYGAERSKTLAETATETRHVVKKLGFATEAK